MLQSKHTNTQRTTSKQLVLRRKIYLCPIKKITHIINHNLKRTLERNKVGIRPNLSTIPQNQIKVQNTCPFLWLQHAVKPCSCLVLNVKLILMLIAWWGGRGDTDSQSNGWNYINHLVHFLSWVLKEFQNK